MLRKFAARSLGPQFHVQERGFEAFFTLRKETCREVLKYNRHLRSISSLASLPGRREDSESLGPRSRLRNSFQKNALPKANRSICHSLSALQGINAEKLCIDSNCIHSELKMASISGGNTLESFNFDNKALRVLPVDESVDPRVQRQVQGACFTSVHQEPLENPETVVVSQAALDLIDLPESEAVRDEFAEYFSGSKPFAGSKPAAHCYCGHQFGYFSGQLGDGAAMYIGEIVNRKGERWELQLKGSGPTPFSRRADGRKVLRSSIREFLCSEAMHALGIPTTRAGSCVTSDTRVVRDIFYDGNPIMEKASVISRIAPTFLRFGSFEIFKPTDAMTGRKGPSVGNKELLHKMLQYAISSFFPETIEMFPDAGPNQYADFYKTVVLRTARLVAQWQAVGFCHGVLNTDNMSILGLTIDYGPFGFMDYYNPDNICNSSDDQGRYSYKNQPSVCKWNLQKFAEALQDALPLDMSMEIFNLYDVEFKKAYYEKMKLKLGLVRKSLDADRPLITSLFDTMKETHADFTNTFRFLSLINPEEESAEREEELMSYIASQCQSIEGLKKAFKTNTDPQQIHLMLNMIRAQPALLQQLGGGAVMQLQKELEKIEKLKELDKLSQGEKTQKDKDIWKKWISTYRKRLQSEFEELEGSKEKEKAMKLRVQIMSENNPAVVLRNYLAQHAIEAAEEGSYEQVEHLLKLLQNPYNKVAQQSEPHLPNSVHCSLEAQNKEIDVNYHATESGETIKIAKSINYQDKAPVWACNLRVS